MMLASERFFATTPLRVGTCRSAVGKLLAQEARTFSPSRSAEMEQIGIADDFLAERSRLVVEISRHYQQLYDRNLLFRISASERNLARNPRALGLMPVCRHREAHVVGQCGK